MKRLILLRHGHAARSQPGESDFDRALDARGAAESEKLGAFLGRHRLMPDVALVSPAVRAQQTWARAAAASAEAPSPHYDPRLYDANCEALLTIVRGASAAAALLVVGHNPGLHELATVLIASGDVEKRERLRENLPPGGLVVVDFAVDGWSKLHPRSGRLELFIEPAGLDAAVD